MLGQMRRNHLELCFCSFHRNESLKGGNIKKLDDRMSRVKSYARQKTTISMGSEIFAEVETQQQIIQLAQEFS